MWQINSVRFTDHASLLCNYSGESQADISAVKLQYFFGDRVQFILSVARDKAQFILRKFSSITPSAQYSIHGPNHQIKFIIITKTNLYLLNQVIALLRQSISDFAAIEANIIKLISPKKALIISTARVHQQDAVARVERNFENNQRASVFITALQSTMKLRAKYNFPCPNYEDEITPLVPFDINNPEAAAIAASIRADDIDQYDYDEHDINKYTPGENTLIASLIEKLESIKTKMLNDGYLETKSIIDSVSEDPDDHFADSDDEVDESRETKVVISELSRRLLTSPSAEDSERSIERARTAFNVITSLNALAPGGSHSHNGAMEQSRITGYGMRNLVALMWKCCLETDEVDDESDRDELSESDNLFMKGITYKDSFKALIRGIASGARGKNRNDDDNSEDDLEEIDKRACDKGRVNALVEAFNGILPDVHIVYEITQLMLNHFESEIIHLLLARSEVVDFETANNYLDIWLGNQRNKAYKQYSVFEQQAIAEFPNMLHRLLTSMGADSHALRRSLKKELDEEITRVESNGVGFKYIEQVSPKHRALKVEWDLLHPQITTNRANKRRNLFG